MSDLTNILKPQTNPTMVTELGRLTPDQYAALAKMVPRPAAPTDGTHAAWLLGCQFVLALVREGFVLGAKS